MKSLKILYGLLVLVILMWLWGCVVGQESFKMGQDLGKQQRWEEALAFYEKALQEDPKNNDYLAALTKAKQEAAKLHFQKAESMLANLSSPNVPDLDRILKEIKMAYDFDSSNPGITSLREKALEKRQALMEEIKALYQQSLTAMEKKEWIEAFQLLQNISRGYPGYEETGDHLMKAKNEGVKRYYQEGLGFIKNEEWPSAARAFKNALDLDPNYLDARELYQKSKANDSAEYYLERGESAGRDRQWDKAVVFITKALDYDPNNEKVVRLLETMKIKAGQEFFNEAIKFAADEKFNKAVYRLQKTVEYDPQFKDSSLYQAALTGISEKLMKRAEAYAAEEKYGNALVWLNKLYEIQPDQNQLFQTMTIAKDNISRRIKKSIAVFDFSSPSYNTDAGKIVANKLITFLYQKASGDLRIIERENLQSILKELQLGQTGLIDMQTAQQVGKMKGIDIFILGDVLHFKSSTKDNPSQKTVMLKVGVNRVKTQSFLEWEARHPNPTREELKTAPPAYEDQPVYERISYTSGMKKIFSFLEISYRMINILTGENTFSNTASGKKEAEDSYNDGIPSGAEIAYDPLEIPDELEILNDLTNSKVAEMGLSILKHFESLQVVYFNEAEQLAKRRKFEEAIEKYMDAAYDEKLKRISSPISEKSAENIQQLILDL
jgi:tetratricopeptide (TPR) repeat protein